MSKHPCQVTHIEPDSAVFITASVPPAGIQLVARIGKIGRVEATAAEAVSGGFKMQFVLNASCRQRLEQRLKWLPEKADGATDQRRHARHEPKDNVSHITMADMCRIFMLA